MARWTKNAQNEVTIEGILSEVNLTTAVDKNGKDVIRGEYKIKTSNTIDGKVYTVEIPVRVYQTKITKNGNPNPAYDNAMRIMNDFVSVAAGGEDKADYIRISNSGQLSENSFYSNTTGQLISGAAIRASFANKISKSDVQPGARFKNVIVIGKITEEVNKDGEETGRLIIKGVLPQWGGKADVLNFVVESEKAIANVRSNWEEGNTVLVGGYINFTSVTTEIKDEDTFGEVAPTQRTRTIRELIITGGHAAPLTEEEGAYDNADVSEALKERQASLEEKKTSTPAPTPAKGVTNFGF